MEWHEAEGMPYGGVYRGGEEVAQNVFGPIVEDIPDFAVTPEEFVASDSKVAVVVRYSGTAKATGNTLDLPAVHVWDVREGKVSRFRQFIDTVKFREAVPAEVTGRT
jgi:ketosteroid isomerase-like protein